MYDIIYSVLCHQNPQYILHFLRNVKKFNKNYKFLVVMHVNEENYKVKHLYENEFIKVNPIYYDKKLATHLILKAYMDNYNFIKDKYEFKYFMYLTSTARFIKQMDIPRILEYNETLQDKIKNKITVNGIWKKKNKEVNGWPKFILNTEIKKVFDDKKLTFYSRRVSSCIISKEVYCKMMDFIIKNKILDKKIERECFFEEHIIPTLYTYFTGKYLISHLHLYDLIYSRVPIFTMNHILSKNDHIFLVKKIKYGTNLYFAIDNLK